MRSPLEVWRRHLWLWALPLAVCLLNLLGYAWYRSFFAGNVERLARTYERSVQVLDELARERELIGGFLDKVDAHQGQVKALYGNQFQTQRQRFTTVIRDIKELAHDAGLEPESLSYPLTDLGEYQLVQRNIRFSVNGSYEQLRTFINFLELTDHFVALNSVTLGDDGSTRTLSINLDLSTIFAAREIEVPDPEPET